MDKKTLIEEIRRLKEEREAIILAHYYQIPEVQDIADVVGDSYKLSLTASQTDAKTIVFCGVHFMAETAKILSPRKTVLLPEKDAGCPMADKITHEDLKAYKAAHPDRKVICYVNSTANVKALSDVCVTSSNFKRVIQHFKGEKLLYVPDKNLGNYVKQTYNLNMEVWPGFCCIHNNLSLKDVERMRENHPEAALIVHPEAPLSVIEAADYVGGTSGLIQFVKTTHYEHYVVGTEKGLLHQMLLEAPDKQFSVLSEGLECKDMKMTDLKSVHRALNDNMHEIRVDENVMNDARKALNLMMELSKE